MAEKKLSVEDGLRFGFGFCAGVTVWAVVWLLIGLAFWWGWVGQWKGT